ncbi:hypothetical protein STEG23_031940 [Scotinomys teguina]
MDARMKKDGVRGVTSRCSENRDEYAVLRKGDRSLGKHLLTYFDDDGNSMEILGPEINFKCFSSGDVQLWF